MIYAIGMFIGCVLAFVWLEAKRDLKIVKKNLEKTELPDESPLQAYSGKSCPPHSWRYEKATGRMKCQTCKNHPFEGNLA